ncbi:MAG: DNA-binding transcriptional regulator FrlR [Bacteroidia bacterium]
MQRTHQYKLLYDRLKREILADVYPVGSVLPSENELCATANLARSTVRQALAQLEAEGYIVKQRGRGSIVKSKRRALDLLSFRGFSASVDEASFTTLSVQEPVLAPWPEDFFFGLSQLEAGAGCICFSRVRQIEAQPVMWETTWLPNLNLPRFARRYRVALSFFEFLGREYQIEITGMNQEIRAVHADSQSARWLRTREGAALLHITRRYHTSRPHLFIYSLLRCDTTHHAMSNASGTLHD